MKTLETLRDRMVSDLKIGGYSPSTRKIYLLYARLFARHRDAARVAALVRHPPAWRAGSIRR